MAIAHAMWVHGHSMQIEYPNLLSSVERKGFSIKVKSPGAQQPNWFHFAIPTPVIVDGHRLKVGKVLIRFRSAAGGGFVKAVHVYDGETKIASKDNLNLNPQQWHLESVDVPNHPEIKWGLGISVGVNFGPDGRELEFSSAGCDFVL